VIRWGKTLQIANRPAFSFAGLPTAQYTTIQTKARPR
jgi:hypothetical protein